MTNVGSGKVLDVYGGSKVFGTKITQQPANGTRAQKWLIAPDIDYHDHFIIQSALARVPVLDVEGGRNADGTPLQIYGNNESKAQAFRFIKQ